jgi:hypothetical protein
VSIKRSERWTGWVYGSSEFLFGKGKEERGNTAAYENYQASGIVIVLCEHFETHEFKASTRVNTCRDHDW